MPKIKDDDFDSVTLTLDAGAASFVKLLDMNSLEIEDVSRSDVKPGMYILKLTLDDGHDKVV